MLNALSNLGVEKRISYLKHRSALVSIIGGLLFVVAASFVLTKPPPGDNQPVYKDRTLVQWLDVGYDGRVNGKDATPNQIKEAEGAVRAIGTNALPFLLTWIRFEPGYPKRFYRGILGLLPLPEHTRAVLWGGTKNERLASLAVYGFVVLNTNALPAFEDLAKLANDPSHPLTRILATKALVTITNTPAL